MRVAIYDVATGAIEMVISAPPDTIALNTAGRPFIELGNDVECTRETHYVEVFDDAWLMSKPPRPSPLHDWDTVAKAWHADLDRARAERTIAINTDCRAAIIGGFTSSALGTPHVYDSEETDQINIVGAALAGVDQPYKCLDPSTDVKSFHLHTAAQLQQLLADGAARKYRCIAQANLLKAQVQAAQTYEELQTIVWSDPG